MKAFKKREEDADFGKGKYFRNEFRLTTLKNKEISSQKKL
jgi:hypothetical protein